MSGSYGLQVGLYNALVANTPLMALITGVYDNPVQAADSGAAAAFPYVTIGDDDITPWDTDTETGSQASVNIHTWSRARNLLETKLIQQAIYNVLHRSTFAITGYTVVMIDLQSQGATRDPDGITIHGVQTLNIIFEVN